MKKRYKASTKVFSMIAVLAGALFILDKFPTVIGVIGGVVFLLGGIILIERIIGRNYTHR